jgi:hypothetical protein
VGDRLYLNKGALQFEDITESAGIRKSGWSTGVTLADVNADGLLDIYVCKSGNYAGKGRANQLYLNRGNLRFEESGTRFGLADTSYTNQAAFFDYDRDGDLDLYLLTSTNQVRNPNLVTPVVADGTGPANDKLYRNDSGPGRSPVHGRYPCCRHPARRVRLGLSVADFNGMGGRMST